MRRSIAAIALLACGVLVTVSGTSSQSQALVLVGLALIGAAAYQSNKRKKS